MVSQTDILKVQRSVALSSRRQASSLAQQQREIRGLPLIQKPISPLESKTTIPKAFKQSEDKVDVYGRKVSRKMYEGVIDILKRQAQGKSGNFYGEPEKQALADYILQKDPELLAAVREGKFTRGSAKVAGFSNLEAQRQSLARQRGTAVLTGSAVKSGKSSQEVLVELERLYPSKTKEALNLKAQLAGQRDVVLTSKEKKEYKIAKTDYGKQKVMDVVRERAYSRLDVIEEKRVKASTPPITIGVKPSKLPQSVVSLFPTTKGIQFVTEKPLKTPETKKRYGFGITGLSIGMDTGVSMGDIEKPMVGDTFYINLSRYFKGGSKKAEESFYPELGGVYATPSITGDRATQIFRVETPEENIKKLKRDFNLRQKLIEEVDRLAKESNDLTKGKVDLVTNKWIGTQAEYNKYQSKYDAYKRAESKLGYAGGRTTKIGVRDVKISKLAGTGIVTGFTGGLLGSGLEKFAGKVGLTEKSKIPISKLYPERKYQVPFSSYITQGTGADAIKVSKEPAEFGGFKIAPPEGIKEDVMLQQILAKPIIPPKFIEVKSQKVEDIFVTPKGLGGVGETVGGIAPYFIPYVGTSLFIATETPEVYKKVSKKGVVLGSLEYAKENPLQIALLGTYGIRKVSRVIKKPIITYEKVGLRKYKKLTGFTGTGAKIVVPGQRAIVQTRFQKILGKKISIPSKYNLDLTLGFGKKVYGGFPYKNLDEYNKAVKALTKAGYTEKAAKEAIRFRKPVVESGAVFSNSFSKSILKEQVVSKGGEVFQAFAVKGGADVKYFDRLRERLTGKQKVSITGKAVAKQVGKGTSVDTELLGFVSKKPKVYGGKGILSGQVFQAKGKGFITKAKKITTKPKGIEVIDISGKVDDVFLKGETKTVTKKLGKIKIYKDIPKREIGISFKKEKLPTEFETLANIRYKQTEKVINPLIQQTPTSKVLLEGTKTKGVSVSLTSTVPTKVKVKGYKTKVDKEVEAYLRKVRTTKGISGIDRQVSEVIIPTGELGKFTKVGKKAVRKKSSEQFLKQMYSQQEDVAKAIGATTSQDIKAMQKTIARESQAPQIKRVVVSKAKVQKQAGLFVPQKSDFRNIVLGGVKVTPQFRDIPKPDFRSLSKPMIKEISPSKEKIIGTQVPGVEFGLGFAQPQGIQERQATDIASRLASTAKQGQKQQQVLSATFAIPPIPIPPEFKIPKPPKPPKPKIPSKKEKELIKRKAPLADKGYNVFAKQGKKFVKISKNPLSRRDALSFGGYVVDNSTSQRFKIKKTKQLPKQTAPKPFFWRLNQQKFRPYKVKRGQKIGLTNDFIERRGYAIDTYGEKQQLKASRVARNLNRSSFGFGTPIKRAKKSKKAKYKAPKLMKMILS